MKHSLAHISRLIDLHRERAAAEGQPFAFPFTAQDVADIYGFNKRSGPGIWFRLHDGRVFDSHGQPAHLDTTLYVSLD